MAAVLQQILERSEISKLQKTVLTKLEKYIADQQCEIDSLKAHQEQNRVDSGKVVLQQARSCRNIMINIVKT